MDIPAWPQSDERERDLLRLVLESPQWGGFHPLIEEFERSFAAFQQCAHGISACNGTLTLELALSVLGVGPGDEVIVPAISFISTATAVSRVGATPVFADLEPWSFNLDPETVAEAIGSRTRAVIAVHFGGLMCQIEQIRALCSRAGLLLIEDAAHAHGAEWSGRRAGSFGITGSFSFQNGKVLSSGEGGMLVTSDNSFAEVARSTANQGRAPGHSFYDHHRIGTNFRMTAFQAAVLVAQLERLPAQNAHRAANAALLKQLLGDVHEIVWQPEPAEQTANPFYLLCARVQSVPGTRDAICRALTEAGVPVTPFYPHTLYQNLAYQRPGSCRVLPCPNAESYLSDAFWLPHRVLLASADTISAIADTVRRALRT